MDSKPIRKIVSRCGVAVLAWCFFLACHPAPKSAPRQEESPDGPIWFRDVTDEVGLNFVHDPGFTGGYFMPLSIGSGAAVFDFDGDGLLDIYLLQNAGPESKSPNRLFRQRPDGTFVDVSAGSGLDVVGYSMGVAVGDVNNDGRPDVLLTQYGGVKHFLNLGGGKFKGITVEAGLHNPLWGTSAAFLDYDRDGRLDLVIINYVDYDPSWACTPLSGVRDFCSPKIFAGTSSKLFRNLGPRAASNSAPAAPVHFEDVSLATGIARLPGPGLGVVVADFNGDGWPDIFVANDGQPNRLWINHEGKTFTEEAASRNVALTSMGHAYAGMGVAVGDIDNTGRLDLFVTHLTNETNTLWKQGPRGSFSDQTAERGLLDASWRGTGFGTLFADFNNDGFLDIAVVNGRIQRGGDARNTGLNAFWEPYAERNQLFANTGKGRFVDISSRNDAFTGPYNVARGLVCADFNNDGAMDLLVNSAGGRARLLRNVAPNRGHWLKVRAIDPQLKRDAYGAEVTVSAGEQKWFRVLSPAGSFLSSGPPILHFGLGVADHIDSIEVRWPDGATETFDGPHAVGHGYAVDQQILLHKGSSRRPGMAVGTIKE
jgi:hypothetical protein